MRQFLWVCLVVMVSLSDCDAQTVPRRIRPTELPDIVDRLALSEEQAASLEAIHRQYEEAIQAEVGDELQKLGELRTLLLNTQSRPELYDAIPSEVEKEFRTRAEAARPIVERNNEQFFVQLQAMLTEAQLTIMPRVRLAHDRQAYKRDRMLIRERNVDMFSMVESLSLTADEKAKIEPIINEIESSYVQAMRRAVEATDDAERHYTAWVDISRRYKIENIPMDDQGLHQMDVHLAKWAETAVPAVEDLVRQNRTALKRFCEVLSPESTDILRTLYYQDAYPEILPDPGGAAILYTTALGMENLSDDQRTAVQALHDQYESEWDRLNTDLMDLLYRATLRLAARKPGYKPDSDKLFLQHVDVGLAREELNSKQKRLLAAVLTPEQLAVLPEWDFEKNPPSRPWDLLRITISSERSRRENLERRNKRVEEFRKSEEEKNARDKKPAEDAPATQPAVPK